MQGFGRVVRAQSDGFAAQAAIGFSNHANRNNHQIKKLFFSDSQDELECAPRSAPKGKAH